MGRFAIELGEVFHLEDLVDVLCLDLGDDLANVSSPAPSTLMLTFGWRLIGVLVFWFWFPTASGWFPLSGTSVADGLALPDCVAVARRWLVRLGDWPAGCAMLIQLVFVR